MVANQERCGNCDGNAKVAWLLQTHIALAIAVGGVRGRAGTDHSASSARCIRDSW